jgi:hypothetical protein
VFARSRVTKKLPAQTNASQFEMQRWFPIERLGWRQVDFLGGFSKNVNKNNELKIWYYNTA